MSTEQRVQRDERTVAVENASYKWAYVFVAYALLIDVMYRGVVRNEAAWDLLALACVPGIICTIYQARHKTLGQGWARAAVLLAGLAGIIGFVAAVLLTLTKAM